MGPHLTVNIRKPVTSTRKHLLWLNHHWWSSLSCHVFWVQDKDKSARLSMVITRMPLPSLNKLGLNLARWGQQTQSGLLPSTQSAAGRLRSCERDGGKAPKVDAHSATPHFSTNS